MSNPTLAAGLRHLRGKLAERSRNEESDEQLLHAFTAQRDDSAFAVLVRRHGPMVLHVCRRVLGHQQDAEDAFQATFLVLTRNAASLRNKTALASYLHGTAYRMAMKAKQSAARRRKHESQTPPRSPVDPSEELSWREVRTLLDEEIARLSEKYRSVFILCCLESVSREEAARRLNLKAGTVSSRLTEARKRLGKRLAKRGVELTAVLAASALAVQPALAVSPVLMASTIKAAMATAAGEQLAGIISASVAELVKGATAAMMVSKAKIATMMLLAVSLLTVATGGSLVFWYERASGPLAATLEPSAGKADDKPKAISPQREAAKGMEIQGRVLDPEGKPKAGAKLLLLGEEGKIGQLGVSAADGRFTVAVPKSKRHYDLVAQVDGAGIDFIDLEPSKPGKPVELRLVKDNAIRGRVVTTEGKPVGSVRVSVRSIGIYESIDAVLDAWKKRHYRWATTPGRVKSLLIESAELLAATTDDDGRFTIHGIGSERIATLRISGRGIADAHSDTMVNRSGFDAKLYNQASLEDIPKEDESYFASRTMLTGPDVAIVAEAEKPIHGIVKAAGTGKVRPNVLVRLTRSSRLPTLENPLQAKTDANGRYEIHGAHKAKSYMVEVSSDPAAGFLACQVWADDTPGYQPVAADITVKKGVIVTGKVIDRATGKSVLGFAEAAALVNNPFAKDYPEFQSTGWGREEGLTGADGSFRIVTIPGPVLLMGGLSRSADNFSEWIKYKSPSVDEKYPQYFFKLPEHVNYYRLGGATAPVQGHFCKVLDIKPGTAVVNQDIVIERASTLEMKIEDGEGRPLSGTWAIGFCPAGIEPIHAP